MSKNIVERTCLPCGISFPEADIQRSPSGNYIATNLGITGCPGCALLEIYSENVSIRKQEGMQCPAVTNPEGYAKVTIRQSS